MSTDGCDCVPCQEIRARYGSVAAWSEMQGVTESGRVRQEQESGRDGNPGGAGIRARCWCRHAPDGHWKKSGRCLRRVGLWQGAGWCPCERYDGTPPLCERCGQGSTEQDPVGAYFAVPRWFHVSCFDAYAEEVRI